MDRDINIAKIKKNRKSYQRTTCGKFASRKIFSKKELALTQLVASYISDIHVEMDDGIISLNSNSYLEKKCSLASVFSISISIAGIKIGVIFDRVFLESILEKPCSYEVFSKLPLELKLAVISPTVDRLFQSGENLSDIVASAKVCGDSPLENKNKGRFWRFSARKNDIAIGGLALYMSNNEIEKLFEKNAALAVSNHKKIFKLNFPIFVKVCLGSVYLKRKSVSFLSIGDVLISDVDADDRKVHLSFSSRLYFGGTVENKILTFNGSGDTIMSSSNDATKGVLKDIDVDDMDLELSFDLGHVCVPLSDIASIKPGYVLEMPDSYEKKVSIRNHGRLVATGELVQVEKNLGVEITEINYGIA